MASRIKSAARKNVAQYEKEQFEYLQAKHRDNFSRYLSEASAGDDAAQVTVGWMYETGTGTEKSYSEAEKWYSEAISKGNLEAEFSLSKLKLKQGVEDTALELLVRGAEKNYPPSLFRLAQTYRHGWGVPADTQKSIQFYEKASSFGHVYAMGELGALYLSGVKGMSFRFRGLYLASRAVIRGLSMFNKDTEFTKE